MWIKDDITIQAIKQAFSQKFPGLKIEFYKDHHEAGEGSPQKAIIDDRVKIGAIRSNHIEGDLQILQDMPVKKLEAIFDQQYGLNVQVFRKSRNLWLQTTATDHWSLKEQNDKGLQTNEEITYGTITEKMD
ncbi:MAG: hypothetical protein KDC57_21800 [Saprospiraceae bacterium]|nr:hypothetical protein [Saprospiraceae bacterium]